MKAIYEYIFRRSYTSDHVLLRVAVKNVMGNGLLRRDLNIHSGKRSFSPPSITHICFLTQTLSLSLSLSHSLTVQCMSPSFSV